MRVNRCLRALGVLTTAIITIRCGSSGSPSNPSPTPTPPPAPTLPAVTTVITGVQASDGTQATQQPGSPPAANGGPTITATTSGTVIPNGTDLAQIQSTSQFQTVYVSVPNTSGIAPADLGGARFGALDAASGYFQLRLPAPVTSVLLLTNLANVSSGSRFTLAYAVANPAGLVGPTVTSTKSVSGQSGGVQVGLTWDTASDVDLHVVDPQGSEVYWANATVMSGGALDVDSNAACAIDNKNNENVRWSGAAPNGTYTVRVDYWSACNVTGTTTYAVVVNNGGSISRFTGTFSANQADQGTAGSGRPITTFNHTTGVSTVSIPLVAPLFSPSPLKLQMSR
ncbi:MAG TPA: hypothetical protein VKE51_41990 [Vicinamibacterales bacterium]|nr:hypothetical protein [Vicinamibacterales bacterium]